MRYAFIKEHRGTWAVSAMAQVVGVSLSGPYDWLKRGKSKRAGEDEVLTEKIVMFHCGSRCTYGSPRIHKDLRAAGHQVGRKRVARLMRAAETVKLCWGIANSETLRRRVLCPTPLKRWFVVPKPARKTLSFPLARTHGSSLAHTGRVGGRRHAAPLEPARYPPANVARLRQTPNCASALPGL